VRIRLTVYILIALLFPLLANATDYYVRDGGTSSACTTWADACDQLSTAENLVARGDTIYVADGAYTNVTFNTATSGASTITIKKATVAAHGTETGWDNAYGDGQAVFSGGVMTFSTGDWVFDGVSRSTETTGHGFKITGLATSNQYGVIINSVDNITIRYTEITSPTTPISDGCAAADSCTRRGIHLSTGSDNFIFEYGYIHDVLVPVLLALDQATFTFRYSVIARNDSTPATHSEAFSISYGTKSNLYIYNNKFIDIEGTAYIAVMNQTTVTGMYLYNNVSYYTSTATQTGTGNGWFTCTNTGTTCSNIYIYNNTIANLPYISARINQGTGAAFSNVVVKNNLWFCNAASCGGADHSTSNVTFDNNWYRGVSHNASEYGAINGGTENPFTDSANYDFSLAAASSPIGEGTDLSATFDDDYALNVRSAPWDIGAYKSGEAAPDTDTPDITTIVINATGTVLTVTLDEDVTVNNSTGFTLACDDGEGEGLSYVSESAGVLTFNITGRAIQTSAVCTLDYATVANGIEDATGNDLETIGDPVLITNNSEYTPTATSYQVSVSVGEGCSLSPASHQTVATGETASITCTPIDNYECVAWTGTCSGSGTTSWSATITADCTATQACRKKASDTTIGSGCAITVGSGPAIKVY